MLTILFTQLLSFTSSLIRLTVKKNHSILAERFLFLNSFIKEMCFELDPLDDLLMHFFKSIKILREEKNGSEGNVNLKKGLLFSVPFIYNQVNVEDYYEKLYGMLCWLNVLK